MLWSGQVASDLARTNDQLFLTYRGQIQQKQMVSLAESLELYFQEHNSFPASLAALVATPGYEQVKSSLNNWQGYGISPSIIDGTWTFTRMVGFMNDPSKGITTASFLANNLCGIGGYNTATSWCGAKSGMWYRKETRDSLVVMINTQRAHFNRLMQKFANYSNANQIYPNVDYSNAALTANTVTSLAALVGYAGTATNCSGQFQYQNIPIDCGDMYDIWGGLVGYQYISDSHIILVSESPIFNNLGSRVVVAADHVP